MKTWIALLRGINVGGKRILRMAELRDSLHALPFSNVSTYIQSGNFVFNSLECAGATLSFMICGCIEKMHGFFPSTLVLNHQELRDSIDSNPFVNSTVDAKFTPFFF